MSSSQSPDTFFVHVHVVIQGKIHCAWYAHSDEDGAWIDLCVLTAEPIKKQDRFDIGVMLSQKFPNIVGVVFVPCTNDHLTPAQKRLIHVD